MARNSSGVYRAVADPNRRRLINLLRAGERPVGELVRELRLSYSAVSQHLSVLRLAGLVKRRADGVHRFYCLDAGPLKEVHDWSGLYHRFWTGKLAKLRRYLDDRS